MKNLMKCLLATVAVCASTAVMAQAPAQLVVSTGISNPAGGFEVNGELWVGDALNGILHLAPTDRTNQNPLDTGVYAADLTQGWTINGNAQFPFIDIGQIYSISDTLVCVAVRSNAKGSDGKSIAGIWTLTFDPQFTFPSSPVGNLTHLVPQKGLSNATSVALGPELDPYLGFANNSNFDRVSGPNNVDSVGGTVNGQPVLSLGFSGVDAYAGVGDGFYKFANPAACQGNKNNCGRPAQIVGGTTSAVATASGRVYFVQPVAGTVSRLNLIDGTIIPVASGLSLGGANTGSAFFDHHGNLWVGGGSNLYRILAADLPL